MTFTTEGSEVLKIDVRGRVRVSKERREEILDEYERSGMSGVKFARLAGINYATFAGWWSRRRRSRGEGGASAVQKSGEGRIHLMEAVVGGRTDVTERLLQIELPGGARVQVGSPMQLRLAVELLAMLGLTGRRTC